ncbi:MAG: helix-turn-helix transcriptional regulator [Candidatus Bipolaricaulis sp.]|nr:helix-turn-helix transcriptional regulator [Candidatus Bipolaricaulis sp.]MDD5220232.1 helix-turn-helix transcriptional regulator [Candidatus Bipolaricaulis sp.]MDD5646821.1 helix-turn-helix transcriptional regulator [Candidatus Bipolaricaulis sp.]
MDELGKRLQVFRLENGLSKRATAQRLGVSTPSIIRWEEGLSEPNDYNRFKIDQLLVGLDVPPRPPARGAIIQLSLFPERIPSTLSRT